MQTQFWKTSAHITDSCRNFLIDKVEKLLSTANAALVTLTLFLWSIYWFSTAWEFFNRSRQFGGHGEACIRDLAIACAITLLLRHISLSARKNPPIALTNIFKRNRFLSALNIFRLTASCATLLLFSTYFSLSAFDDTSKGLACAASDLGQYELAERFYAIAPDLNHKKRNERYSSMAAWHTSSTYESPNVLRMKNAAVAAVYGDQSREMADRYFYLGLTCGQGRENHDSEALYWFNKAFTLHKQNHAVTKCVDALAELASIEYSNNHKAESKRVMAQAALLMPFLDEEPYV